MNNKTLLLFFFLVLSLGLQAQTRQLIGSYWNGSQEIFAALDLTTNTFYDIDVMDGVTSLRPGETTFDPTNNRYFNITAVGLLTINAQTGAILSVNNTDKARTIKGMEYDPSSDKLYGTYWTGSQEIFTALDLTTNTFSDIAVLPGVRSLILGESTFDPVNSRYFNNTNLGITTIDVNTGAILGTRNTGRSRALRGMEYDTSANKIYGTYWTGSQQVFTALDLSTNVFSDLNVLNGVQVVFNLVATFDLENRRYFNHTNLGITEINVVTGNIINTIPLPKPYKNLEYTLIDVTPVAVALVCPGTNVGLPGGCNPMLPTPDVTLPEIILGSGVITHEGDQVTDVGCRRLVDRTYRATAANGYFDECIQTFAFTFDTIKPIIQRSSYSLMQVGEDIDGANAGSEAGAVSLSKDGERLAVGASRQIVNGTEVGHVRVFQLNGTNWIQIGADIEGVDEFGQFGNQVILSDDGNRLVISARSEDTPNGSQTGRIRVYDWNGMNWIQVGNDIDGTFPDGSFGASLALSAPGDRLLVGALPLPTNGLDGYAQVYGWNGTNWAQVGNNIAEGLSDLAGFSVDISDSGNRIIVGAPSNDNTGNGSGRLQVYDWDGVNWVQTGADINGVTAGEALGAGVSISADGNRLAVGATQGFNVNPGYVQVYDWNGTTWNQVDVDIIGEAGSDQFGRELVLSDDGNRLMIAGTRNDDNGRNAGHVRVYDLIDQKWVQIVDDIDGEAARDQSGESISLSGDGSQLAIGSFFNDGNGSNSGHARIYNISSEVLLSSNITIDCNDSTDPSNTGSPVGVFDNCGSSSVPVFSDENLTNASGDELIRRTWTTTDDCGNSSSFVQLITLVDNSLPIALCQDITVELGPTGSAVINAAQLDGGSTDNCSASSALTFSASQTTFTCSDLNTTCDGSVPVVLTVTDEDGNSATCTANVFIEDNTAPTANCQDITLQLDANGEATLIASQLNNGSSDNCTADADLTFSASQTTFTCNDLNATCNGSIPVTLTVTDQCGNPATCTANVFIEDNTAPTANCQDITLQLDANGEATLIASQLNNGSSDNCTADTDLTFSASQTAFTCNDLNATCDGSIPVTLTVTDQCGNPATCTVNVFIEDTIPPTATCQALTLQLDANGQATLTADQLNNGSSDNCTAEADLTLSASQTTFTCAGLNGACSTVIPVTLTATDACGNAAACTANVTLQDNNPPVPLCRDLILQLDANGRATINPIDLNVGSSDNCTPANELIFNASQTVFTCDDLNASCDGSIPVTLTVTDQCGNSSTCISNVSIEDNIGPVFTNCPGDFAVTLDPGDCFFIYDFDLLATDNCTNDIVVRQTEGPRSGAQLDHTTSTLFAFEAEDACGNITRCAYEVTVNEFPFIDTELGCNDNVQISLDEHCEAIVGVDLILEGGQYGCYDTRYGVTIDFNGNGVFETSEGNVLGANDVGMSYTVQVMDLVTGNACWGSIEVEDKLIPDLLCEAINALCSDDLSPEALGFPVPRGVVVTANGDGTYRVSGFDACGGATLSFVDTEDPRQCQTISNVITRSWTIVDGSGNRTSCDQLISLERATLAAVITPPDWDNTDEEALNCENRCDTTDTRFCGPDNLYWNVLPAGHPYAGNPSPYDELWGCGAVKCFGTGAPDGVSCGDIQFTFEDTRINICPTGSSNSCFKVLRKWTIFDWCTGNSIFHNQIIKVEDTRGPQINELEDVQISTDVWRCEADWLATVPRIEDNCSSEPITYIVESSAGIVEQVNGQWRINQLPRGTHQVDYIATDCCGNTTTRTIQLTVIDDVPPVVVCDEHTVVALSTTQNNGTNGLGRTRVPASVFDDGSFDQCGAITFRARRVTPGCGSTSFSSFVDFCCSDIGLRNLMVELQVTDQFRNSSTCMIEVEVQDKLAPTLVAPPDLTITCDYWFPFDPDRPDENLETLDERFGKIVDLVGEEEPDSIVVRDRVCEAHPRFGEYAPASIFDDPCYDDSYDIFWGFDGFGIDNCGFELEQTVISNLHCGRGDILRRWRAEDAFGNWSNTATQRITIIDCKAWYVPTACWRFTPADVAACDLINIPSTGLRYRAKLIEWPCDVEITTCYGQGVEPDVFHPDNLQVTFEQDRRPRFDDDNCNLLAATYEDETFTFVDGACQKIFRTWTVIDWCLYEDFQNGNYQGEWRWEWIQVIKLLNQQGPTFDSCEDLTFCGYGDPDNPDNPQCVGVIELLPEFEDDCTESEELKVDFKLDAFNDGTYDLLGYSDNYGLVYPFPNPNSLPVRRFTADEANADGTYPVGTHRILWSLEDGCGNTGACEYLFTIEDCKPPTAYCKIGVSTIPMPQDAGGYLDIWASDFNLGSSDNCTDTTDLIFSFSDDINDRNRRLTCDDAGKQLDYSIYVWDEAGNYSSCLVGIILNDCKGNSTYNITGEISDEEGRMVEEVAVGFNANTNASQMTTDITGFFNFLNEEAGQNITITPEKDINHRNGVTTFDIVLMSKHILGIEGLDSPYKMIAADVNRSGTITTFDMVELRKLILFVDNDFRNNTSWRFIDKGFIFPNARNPFETVFPEAYSINDLSEDEQADFIGVKIGDVNGSASPNRLVGSGERSRNETLFFNIADQPLEAGKEYRIDFKAQAFQAITGYQFSLNFDVEVLEFVGVESGILPGLEASNFGTSLLPKGILTTSWNSNLATSIDDESTAFSLIIRAKKETLLSEHLSISADYMLAQAYNDNLDILNIGLGFQPDDQQPARFELMQNQPNPFRAETVIGFSLPQAGVATMTFYDVSGKVLRSIRGDYSKGYHEISINRSELAGSGVLYYTLETETNRASKRMILLE